MRVTVWTMMSLSLLLASCTQLETERLFQCANDSDCSDGWVCKPLQRERTTSVCVKEGTELSWMLASDAAGLDADTETVGLDVPMETDSISNDSTSPDMETRLDVCEPDCGGRTCGSDGCGGRCEPGCLERQMCDEGACVSASCDLIGRTMTLGADCSNSTGVCDPSSICGDGSGSSDICFQVCLPGNGEPCCPFDNKCTELTGATFPYTLQTLGVCTPL
ncbi:MAG: hypothetical protein AUK47_03625 [Deltaproteobacteria bacterium CG2_30_63_29]|nr:MAG: hypothetical protein AUK47_03625 [Deltaproteobacteria bacterium CG2_30_63_29]